MEENIHRAPIVPSRSMALVSKTRHRAERPLILSALRGGLIGAGCAAVLGLILIAVGAAVALKYSDPAPLVRPLSLVSLLISMFIGGFTASKITGEAPLTCGIVSGGIITVASLILSLILPFLPSAGYGFWQSAALHSAAVAFSVLGSFAGNVRLAPKRNKKRFGK